MKKVYIITNTAKDPSLSVTGNLVSLLKKQEIESVLAPAPMEKDVDCIFVLGGDGTLLKAATDFADVDIPFLGINLGNLGFMTEIEIGQMDSAVAALKNHAYSIEERMMINGRLSRKNSQPAVYHALNDIVLTRKGSLHILAFEIYVNGQFLHSYKADGMIVSTPTGSTGYNMSAGGPIVDPKAQMILITPINAHNLNSRSIVIGAEDEVMVEIGKRRSQKDEMVEVSFDGNNAVKLEVGDRFIVHRATDTAKICKLWKESFLEILRKKMQAYT